MSLTQEQIEKLANNLSKLKLDDEKLANNINDILKYVDLLNEVDTTWVVPTVSVSEKDLSASWRWNILREDIQKEKEVTPAELLKCSNQKVVANQIAVSNIMK